MRLCVARAIIRGSGPIRAKNTTFSLQMARKTGHTLYVGVLLKAQMSCFCLQWNPFALGLIGDSVG